MATAQKLESSKSSVRLFHKKQKTKKNTKIAAFMDADFSIQRYREMRIWKIIPQYNLDYKCENAIRTF